MTLINSDKSQNLSTCPIKICTTWAWFLIIIASQTMAHRSLVLLELTLLERKIIWFQVLLCAARRWRMQYEKDNKINNLIICIEDKNVCLRCKKKWCCTNIYTVEHVNNISLHLSTVHLTFSCFKVCLFLSPSNRQTAQCDLYNVGCISYLASDKHR